MEYMNEINDSLQSIEEGNITYIDLFSRPDLFTGLLCNGGDKVDFSKMPLSEEKRLLEDKKIHQGLIDSVNRTTSGSMLCFHTNSRRLIFKVRLKRKWGFQKMVKWNCSGFDVYQIQHGQMLHETVFAPADPHDVFAHQISSFSGDLCVYLPTYNTILELMIGIEKGSILKALLPQNTQPIVFYGNSVTQGASASRSGNIFPNIVGRKLERTIINLSFSACCRGHIEMADVIGRLDSHSVVIDYSRNAPGLEYFRKTYEPFYRRVRGLQPDKPIVLLTSACFNEMSEYYNKYDQVIRETWQRAYDMGEKVELVDQTALFQDDFWDCVTVDGIHYIDYGMYRVADAVCDALRACEGN